MSISLYKSDELSSWIIYKKNWFSLSDEEFTTLKNMMPTVHHQIKIFDKTVDLPRLQLCFGQSYKYSGTTSEAIKEIPPVIQRAMDAVNNHFMKSTHTKIPIYSMCLVNYYRNGDDYIGFHSDDEKQIMPNTPIYSLSFGAKRRFQFKIKDKFENQKVENKLDKFEIEPDNNSLIIMGGACQKTHKHSLPKQKNVSDLRINLTFRAFTN